MNTDHLEYFLAICEEQSVARAAERLFISPQGLRKAVHQLEQALGVQLFEGEGEDRRLTAYGEIAHVCAQRMIAERDAMVSHFAEISRRETQTMRVAFAYGVLGALGLSFIDGFGEARRETRVAYTQVPDHECDRMLLERKIDVGFTVAPYHPELETYELGREQSILWVESSNPLACLEVARIDDLRGQRLAVIGSGFKMFDELPRLCRERGFELEIGFATPEMGMVKQLAGHDGLVALTVAHEGVETPPGLASVPLEGVDWRYGVSIVHGRALTEAQRWFLEFARGWAGKDPTR